MGTIIKIMLVGTAALLFAACEDERARPTGAATGGADGAAVQPADRHEENETGGPATTPEQRELEDRAYRIQGQGL